MAILLSHLGIKARRPSCSLWGPYVEHMRSLRVEIQVKRFLREGEDSCRCRVTRGYGSCEDRLSLHLKDPLDIDHDNPEHHEDTLLAFRRSTVIQIVTKWILDWLHTRSK